MKKILFSIIVGVILPTPLLAQLFVAMDGSDTSSGTFDKPFKTIPKAIAVAVPGDTIYVRGGSYPLTSTILISSNQNGSDSNRHYLFAYPGERPLLDFSTSAGGVKGISLKASYWYIKGLDIAGAGDNGMEIDGGNDNIIEFCAFYENRDSGLQLSNGAANNHIINCDAYYNADPPDYGDADGFAPKLTVGSGNYFYGCRSWQNCDDGWDGYLRGSDNVTTTLENCWTWLNGYRKDGSDPGPQANGNGFKLGGGDSSNVRQLMHHFVLIKCLSFANKGKGFDQNNNVGSMTLLNCSGYQDKVANYRITKVLKTEQTLTVKNCLSFAGNVELGSFAIQEMNSWSPPFVVTSADFLSLDPTIAALSRQPDGSLPEIEFMHLAAGSDLIDAGTDLGFPFNGTAPDLGAFESNYTTVLSSENLNPAVFRLDQNFPNPFNPATTIQYSLFKPGFITLKIYNSIGQEVETLVNECQMAGEYQYYWRSQCRAGGNYFYRLQSNDFSETKKFVVQK